MYNTSHEELVQMELNSLRSKIEEMKLEIIEEMKLELEEMKLEETNSSNFLTSLLNRFFSLFKNREKRSIQKVKSLPTKQKTGNAFFKDAYSKKIDEVIRKGHLNG